MISRILRLEKYSRNNVILIHELHRMEFKPLKV